MLVVLFDPGKDHLHVASAEDALQTGEGLGGAKIHTADVGEIEDEVANRLGTEILFFNQCSASLFYLHNGPEEEETGELRYVNLVADLMEEMSLDRVSANGRLNNLA